MNKHSMNDCVDAAYIGIAEATGALRAIVEAYASGKLNAEARSKVNYYLLTLIIRLLEGIDLWDTVVAGWTPDVDRFRAEKRFDF